MSLRDTDRDGKRVRYKIIRGMLASWQALFDEASEFATRIGRDDVINISHSEDHSEGVIVVWYWE